MITFINEEEKLKHPYYKLDGIERRYFGSRIKFLVKRLDLISMAMLE
jgi:hypothetical protein